jgi:hypothetical protein
LKITKRQIAVGIASTATVAAGLGVATTIDTASAAAKVHTLKFVAVGTGSHNTGNNTFVGTDVERHHGTVVGYDTLSGKFNINTHKVFIRVAVARKGGLLYAHLTQNQSGDFAGRVTGGAGRFKGARGTVTGHSGPHNKTFVTLRYHF